ncbi:hypothetical protein HGRIS_013778 [Hohenbuehelia grisea]|uniref:Peroxin-3 n=1 Tax=Hohenbuehelia grisea TaxID=104357 RepID=A0ABR3IWN0_9AGAR
METVKTYVYRRRKCLAKTAGAVGGVYLAAKYIRARLEEATESLMKERLAKDNLRLRFYQTQEDISYTIMALIPTLAEQIIQEMDVESLTSELQALSRASKAAQIPTTPDPTLIPPHPNSAASLTSSTNPDHDNHDARSDTESLTHSVATSAPSEDAPSQLEYSSQSWVENMSATTSSVDYSAEAAPSPSIASASLSESAQYGLPGQTLSDSFISTNSSMLSYPEGSVTSHPSQSDTSPSAPPSQPLRTKSELWNEIKILTFTRAMTIIYSTSLLSLFETLQLTILARSKYVQSVLKQSRDEQRSEFMSMFSPFSLIGGGLGEFLNEMDTSERGSGGIDEEVERQFLTLSWWISHVGWKDVGERVRKAVEDSLHPVSLKSKLALSDIRRIIFDIRRRVEYEITFEGRERAITFMSMLLPPTPEMTQHALVQAGYLPPSPSIDPYDTDFPPLLHEPPRPPSPPVSQQPNIRDPQFVELIEETHRTIASSDFQRVVDACLERAVHVLFDDLEHGFFRSQQEDGSSNEPRIRLAALLPGLARWSRDVLNGLPNVLVDVSVSAKLCG